MHAAANPKVAIIVGATHGATAGYRTDANQVYAEAIKYTNQVVKVYSPNATWSKVKAAVDGASIVVYLGHGNGWPSPYTYDPNYTTKDGFGLNADLNGDGKLSDYENKYYGEPKIETLTPAPNAVVLLFHLCYASGNSEPGKADPSLSVARQRVDNYASAFLRAGARAVIANGHSHDPYYIRALFTTRQTIEQYWRDAPDANDHVSAHTSSRTSWATSLMDPESAGNYYRSITGKLTLNTADVTGASYASTSGDPAAFAVPGNASPKADGTPVYGSARGRGGRHGSHRDGRDRGQGPARGDREPAHAGRLGDLPDAHGRRRRWLDAGREPASPVTAPRRACGRRTTAPGRSRRTAMGPRTTTRSRSACRRRRRGRSASSMRTGIRSRRTATAVRRATRRGSRGHRPRAPWTTARTPGPSRRPMPGATARWRPTGTSSSTRGRRT